MLEQAPLRHMDGPMAVVGTVARFLDEKRVSYRVIPHPHANSSSETAEAAHVSGERIAKGVVLKDAGGSYCLAVLPATHVLDVELLSAQAGRNLEVADEDDLGQLFADCELGAVPAVGRAYGLATCVDESLLEQPEIFFEGGEHSELVGVDVTDFERLMDGASYATFSAHTT